MQIRQLAIATLVAGFALSVMGDPAAAQSKTDTPQASVKKNPVKKRVVRRSPAGGQIACTAAGCGRIPANCHPTQGYRWDGMPSGFDVVVCP
jgi:hypothetical protein